jgi:hypothetical protein
MNDLFIAIRETKTDFSMAFLNIANNPNNGWSQVKRFVMGRI